MAAGVDVNLAEEYGCTPLFMAAQHGFEEVVHELMSVKDIDIEKANDQGVTPLSIAANDGHRDVVLKMLASGDIDVNQTDNEGDTPLTMAATMGRLGMVQVRLLPVLNQPLSEHQPCLLLPCDALVMITPKHVANLSCRFIRPSDCAILTRCAGTYIDRQHRRESIQ